MEGELEFHSCLWLFSVNQLWFPSGEVFTFSEGLAGIFLCSPSSKGGSRKELPPLNCYRICGLYHPFAIDHRLPLLLTFSVCPFILPYSDRDVLWFAQGLPRNLDWFTGQVGQHLFPQHPVSLPPSPFPSALSEFGKCMLPSVEQIDWW